MSKPPSVAEAAVTGDRGRTLRALRDRLAAEIDLCDKPELLPGLSRRLEDVLAALGDLPDPDAKRSKLGALTDARTARGASTATERRTGRR